MLRGFKIKKIVILFTIIFVLFLHAEEKYDPFTEQQIKYIDKLGSIEVTQEEIQEILLRQKMSYVNGLEKIMINKKAYIETAGSYDTEIFALEKIMKINQRAGNTYAVLRDEVQIKSFKILANQHIMMKNILKALDDTDRASFSQSFEKIISKNIQDNKALTDKDYESYMSVKSSSKALAKAKINIKEYYAIIDINNDVLNFLKLSEDKMFRLSKYSKYNLIRLVFLVEKSNMSQVIDPMLKPYGLDLVKILIISTLIFIIYITRFFLYVVVERKIAQSKSQSIYSQEIFNSIKVPLARLVLVFSIHMMVYVYSDFVQAPLMVKFFNMLYSAIFTIIVYKVLNTIAKIKVNSLHTSNTKVKNDVINVGIKIINFLVLLMGLMLVLHFAGANLTAILSGLGIGGLAVALAAKDSLANFFGTLSILFSDVLSQGDWIEVNGQEGVVVEIGTRVTTLRTFDNALIAIPNAILANQDVKNWNKRSLGRRIKMSLGVKYDSKSEDIKSAIFDIREMLENHEAIATESTEYTYKQRSGPRLVSKDDAQGIKKTLLVYLDDFGDSSINILVYCFSKSVDWEDWLATKEDIMHKIMAIFERNNLEFAFPSLSIYSEEPKAILSRTTELS